MKPYFYILVLLIISNFSNAQVIQSDCSAPDSIVDLYNEDAQRLTLDRIFDQNFPYVDSVIIPTSYSDTVLKALIAVYNAFGIPERDTVIDMLDIHSRTTISMNNFYLSADSLLGWMQNLSLGNLNTGQSVLDDIIATYGFTLTSYSPHPIQSFATAIFLSNDNYNLQPITDAIETITGVWWAESNNWGGDGSTIYSTIYPNYVELTYRYAWGDCPAGCTGERAWKFKVYYDCSVEYIGTEGSVLPPTASINIKETTPLCLYPNPFCNSISIDGVKGIYSYQILNLNGEIITEGTSSNMNIHLNELVKGSYIISIQSDNQTSRKRIIKL